MKHLYLLCLCLLLSLQGLAIGPIIGANDVCVGNTITLSDTATGGTWTSSNTSVADITLTSGVLSGISPGTAVITYTYSSSYVTTTITVNALPIAYHVTGGGSFCSNDSGAHVGLDSSNAGFLYQLLRNGISTGNPIPGTDTVLDFGLFTAGGTYTVHAIDVTTTCMNDMDSSALLAVKAAPIIYAVSGGGTFCADTVGVHIMLSNSSNGISYQVIRNTLPTGSGLYGTGAALDFGSFTYGGTYTILATDTGNHCTSAMTDSAIIIVHALPVPYIVSGGGLYCTDIPGVHVKLMRSESTVNYQLFYNGNATGNIMPGTGGTLDFGLFNTSGTYSVQGINANTNCTNSMLTNAAISINPLPNVYTATGGGTYWPEDKGVAIKLNGSDAGVIYQLFNGTVPVGNSMPGTGGAIDFGTVPAGTYNIQAINPVTFCSLAMADSIKVVLLKDAKVAISPNPSGGELVIKMDKGSYQSFTITNEVGQMVMQEQITTTETTLDIKSLAGGMYYITFRGNHGSKMMKFVKL